MSSDEVKEAQRTTHYWEGLKDHTIIVYSGFPAFVRKEQIRFGEEDYHSTPRKYAEENGISEDHLMELLKCDGVERMIDERDCVGREHFLGALRAQYSVNLVSSRSAWSFGQSMFELEEKLKVDEDLMAQMANSNLILIGGPRGNLLTHFFLHKMGLEGLVLKGSGNERHFDLAVGGDTGDGGNSLVHPKWDGDVLVRDCGVFLKAWNPLSARKDRCVAIAMGLWGPGTQAAAALSFTARGAEFLSADLDSRDFKNEWLRSVVGLHVWRRDDESKDVRKCGSDTGVRFQVVYPERMPLPKLTNHIASEDYLGTTIVERFKKNLAGVSEKMGEVKERVTVSEATIGRIDATVTDMGKDVTTLKTSVAKIEVSIDSQKSSQEKGFETIEKGNKEMVSMMEKMGDKRLALWMKVSGVGMLLLAGIAGGKYLGPLFAEDKKDAVPTIEQPKDEDPPEVP